MHGWNWKLCFDQIYRHFGVISALQAAGLICIVGLFVLGLVRRHRWKSKPIFPGKNENVLSDMWLARCGVWVAVVAFLLGWMPQIRWLHHNLMTGFYQECSESLNFEGFGNLYIGSVVLTVGFAQYFILQFLFSGVAIKRALTEASRKPQEMGSVGVSP